MLLLRELIAAVLLSGQVVAPSSPIAPDSGFSCDGPLKQGGLLACTAEPGTKIKLGNRVVAVADEQGRASIGFAQKAPKQVILSAKSGSDNIALTLDIEPRDDPYREITGLDCDKVDARTQAQKDHAGRSWVKKQAAFKTFEAGQGAHTDWLRPAEGRTSSPFGPTRKYIGVSKVTGEPCDKTSIHRGYDIATPVGTPIIAPADGVVTLADLDLYYEGGTVFLDHGQGLVSVFMHMSALDVKAGERVQQGDKVGETGNTGRTTGPHLHWAVKWRNTASDNRGGDFYIDPALLLEN